MRTLLILTIALAGFAGAEVQAGFARVDITPEAGAQIPGGFAQKLAEGVHDPLFAEACVVRNGDMTLAIVGVDALFVPDTVVAEARRLIAERGGPPADHVLIGASHTHTGGPIVACFGSDADPPYQQRVAEAVARAVSEAQAAVQPVHVAAGIGHEDSVSFNRRFKMKDGSVRTHPGKMNPDIVEPEGPMDPDVAVISFSTPDGKPIGCIANHALHCTCMGGGKFSADYVHYLKNTVRAVQGEDLGIVYLNGACGDVTQVDNRNARTGEFGEAWTRRVGTLLGAEVVKVLAQAEYAADAPLAADRVVIDLAIRDLAESDAALVAREAPASGLAANADEVFLREAALVREMQAQSPTVPVEVQALCIGDAAIVTNPTEYFCALGLNIKARSPWPVTLVSELSNGYAGYCPTRAAFDGGGYETRTARSSFLAPGSGERIADVSVDLLNKLYPAPSEAAP
ncbi:MAG: hypothetical protein IT368_11615 [Candidatus Hydrogenedentes bacterium]|nr:hypothetical protein [Candidatus Hydrogenedentota bacterium]